MMYNNKKVKDLIDYIDFHAICDDYNLENGDISINDIDSLETIIRNFIESNSMGETCRNGKEWDNCECC